MVPRDKTAVPLWGQVTQKFTSLSPKRDCGLKRVNHSVPKCKDRLVSRLQFSTQSMFIVSY